MNIINYIYDKGKKIYNRSSNISSSTGNSQIENENLISKFSDINTHNNNYSSNYSKKKHYKSTLSPSKLLKLNGKILKNKKNKGKSSKKDVFVNGDSDKNSKSDPNDVYRNEEKQQLSQKHLERPNFSNNELLQKTNDSNTQVRGDDISLHEKKWKQKYDSNERRQWKEEEKENETKKKWCTDPNFNEHILAEGGFKVDCIRHDKKIYQNRCDGVCALNDNIYIFDKIKKSIYLYTPYNNVWHIFLDIYEEVATRKKGIVDNSVSDNEIEKKKEKNSQSAENFKYLNNISFTNYTDMVFLNNCIFVISSNSQFMNMCKINISNMSTIFNTILVDSLNEQVNSFEDIFKLLKNENTQKDEKREEIRHDKENVKREYVAKDSGNKKYSEKSDVLKDSSLVINETSLRVNSTDKNSSDKKNNEDNFSNFSESDEYNEYTKGAFEIRNYLENNRKEKKNVCYEKKRGKEKKIIKPRDLFSICSVNENCYSLMYLFGGKGNSVKQKNEYVDNIYNDLYVYDFFKNKWFELYIYKDNEEENESSNSVVGGDVYKDTISEWAIFKDSHKSENKKRTNQWQYNKDYENWANEQIYQTEQIEPIEQSPMSSWKHAREAFETVPSTINTIANKENSFLFSNVGNSAIFNLSEKKNGGSIDSLNKIGNDCTKSASSRFKKSFSSEINLIKLSSSSSRSRSSSVRSNKTSNINNIHISNGNGKTSNDMIYNDMLCNDMLCNDMLWKTKEITSSEKRVIFGGKGKKEPFCATCANNINNENGKKKCKYICDLQKNNIRVKKMKWLHKRAGHSCVYYKNNLYFFGGISYYSFSSNKINLTFCNNLYLYNIESNECFEILAKGIIPEKRYRHSCVLINDYMFILGGETQDCTLPKNDLFYYNFSNSVWTEINLSSQINFHSLYKTVWLENFGSIYMFGSSILRLTKKNFQYTPAYKSKRKGSKKLNL